MRREQSVDPASLNGAELRAWYERSPEDIRLSKAEEERGRWDRFAAETRALPRQSEAVQPAVATEDDSPWVHNGRGELRRLSPTRQGEFLEDEEWRPDLPGLNTRPRIIAIGNPANPGLRRQWEEREGRPWPRTEDGKPYDVGHVRAKADGGSDTLDNIEPLHPEEHRRRHREDGDSSRWSKRPGIARAFGGRVVRGLGMLPSITGILSGRIRTDTFDNFVSDMMGWPSEADRQRALEREQQIINPAWKPGDPIVV